MRRGPRVPEERVARMYADYCRPLSLAAVGRLYDRHQKSIRELFVSRGLAVRVDPRGTARRRPDGTIAPVWKLSEDTIEALIGCQTRMRVPGCLKQEWRGWTLERRAAFVRRLRAKLALPTDQPTTPFSPNVTPFDYGTPEAWEICRRMNAGRSSRTAAVKIDVGSQGVIWRGRLWFWCHKVGYQSGPWTPAGGRPALHKVIWEEANGRPVPAHHVLVFVDGNHNHLLPENLALKHRGDLAVENKQAGVLKRGRHDRFFRMHAAAAALTHA